MQGNGFSLTGNHFLKDEALYLPLYEGKLLFFYDHRFSTYENASQAELNAGRLPQTDAIQKRNPHFSNLPQYWVSEADINARADFEWVLAFRDVTNSVNERTAIFSLLPRSAVGHKAPLMFFENILASEVGCLVANMSSYLFDYIARQKVGGTSLSYFILKQLPVLPPDAYTPDLRAFIVPRVLELTYTAWDLQPFAQDVGYEGPPFVWDDERRFLMRCELDALYFHLYEISRGDAAYILDTFNIVKRKDEAKYDGVYLTKETILEMYDEMADAGGVVGYQSRLTPGPADASVAHKETK